MCNLLPLRKTNHWMSQRVHEVHESEASGKTDKGQWAGGGDTNTTGTGGDDTGEKGGICMIEATMRSIMVGKG